MKRIINHYGYGVDKTLNKVRRIIQKSSSTSLMGLNDNEWRDIIKANGHQYRMPKVTVKVVTNKLRGCLCLKNSFFKTFEDLYDCLRQNIGGIPYVGDLAVYDIALRIGSVLNPAIYPKDYVYLAAGAMKGFKKLYPNVKPNFRVPVSVFNGLFGNMESYHIEDILCIYKDCFRAGGVICAPNVSTCLKESTCVIRLASIKACATKSKSSKGGC